MACAGADQIEVQGLDQAITDLEGTGGCMVRGDGRVNRVGAIHEVACGGKQDGW